jgi:hypothetical protein
MREVMEVLSMTEKLIAEKKLEGDHEWGET